MLVHWCSDCAAISINRIAADDDARTILGIFTDSSTLSAHARDLIRASGVEALGPGDLPLVQLRLFGQGAHIPIAQPA
jgi:hypothetical protein